ncbi:hypothetical protein VTK73DRAFT_6754 [Phialemonium thermophilum]|uniref:Uncharacterized protein n=1 Tax=Phialemonium thermophilum TaxID=223376 RepID=A0ABR3WI08_9PEZI
MASHSTVPTAATIPDGPRPRGGDVSDMPGRTIKGDLLVDLPRQLDDSTSEVASSTTSSGRRRRRRSKKALAPAGGKMSAPPVHPRISETKPVRLQLGLNLDVELELKARLQGDVSLTLLAEKKPAPRPSPELQLDADGVARKEELFYLRLGTLRLRQRWIDREVSESLTAMVAFGMALGGFVLGFVTSRVLDSILLQVG